MAETFSLSELKTRMQKSIASLKDELTGLRTGRASPSLLEPVQVEAYGSKMPLNQVATVSAPEPRLLSVQVWDRSNVTPVEKAIRSAGLGLNPSPQNGEAWNDPHRLARLYVDRTRTPAGELIMQDKAADLGGH